MSWLSDGENALLTELILTFILCFYWIKDPSLPVDVDAAFEASLANFPEQQFMATLRSSAAHAGVQLKAPTQEYFVCPRLGNFAYVDYAAIGKYVAQTALNFNIFVSNSDLEYRRIRDGIYVSNLQGKEARRLVAFIAFLMHVLSAFHHYS